MKIFSRLMVVVACCMAAGGLSGKSFSLDLRPVSAKAGSRAQVNAKSASVSRGNPDYIRRTSLDAGSADVGAVAVGDELSFTLFNDVEMKLVLRKKMPAPLGGDAFIAEVSGYDGVKSAVVLRTADGLTVDIQDCRNNKFYKVISTSTNVRVEEIEPKVGKCGCGVRPPPSPPATPAARKSANVVKSAKADEDVCVDVLVAYDKDARKWAGENGGGITNFAQMAVQRMNAVLVNNDLDTLFRFRLVGIVCVNVSTNDLDAAVDSATFGMGGWAPIKDMRDKVGADVVAVLVDTGTDADITGLAWSMMPDNYAKFSEHAYSACSVRSVSWSHTMTHEVGHNLGAGHSELQRIDPGPQLYSYSAGYFFWAGGVKYHTVMSYGDEESEGNSAPYFSSPKHAYKGGAVGDASHDNVLTISRTYTIAANWREAKGEEITEGFDDVPVQWVTSRTKAFAKARDEGKLVFMLYGSDTCGISTALMEGSCEEPAVRARLRDGFICWYCTDYDEAEEYLQDAGTPQTAIVDPSSPDGYLCFAGGFLDVDDLLFLIAKATHENEFSALVDGYTWTALQVEDLAMVVSVSPKPAGDMSMPAVIGGRAITRFDTDLFRGNANLTSAVIPEGVSQVPDRAFADCCNLTNVVVPASVVEIGLNPFTGCSPQMKIEVSPDNPNYSGREDVICDKESLRVVLAIDRPVVRIPDGVAEIADGAFLGCRNVSQVVVPRGVENIGQWAVYGMGGLEREGHALVGWATSPDGQGLIAEDTRFSDLTPGADGCVTLYAIWDVASYVVTFDANGGEGGWSRTMKYGSAIAAPTVTRAGHVFNGWSPDVAATVPPCNVTYKAQWRLPIAGTIVVRAFGPTTAGGTARLVLGRTGGSEGRIAVKAKTQSSTGICGTDFAYVKEVLVWEDGDTSDKVLEIPTYGSGVGKSLRVKLATLTTGTYAGCVTPTLAESKVYAEMTEPNPGAIVVTAPDPLTVTAGETLRMAFARRGGSDGKIAVKAKTQTSTALMGTNGSADFDYVKKNLEWGDGDATMRYLDIPTYVQPWEGVKMFRVKLATLATGAYAGNLTPTLAESKIYANIESPVAFGTVSVASEAVRPKAGETLRLVFRRAGGNDYPIAVKYKVQTSTAVAGTDFEYKKGVVTWGDGESDEQIVEVPIFPSAAGKQLRVKLSSLTQGAYEGCVTPHLASAKVYVSLW